MLFYVSYISPSPPCLLLAAHISLGLARYMTFDSFAWDQGAYNSPKVSVYVPLDGVGAVKGRVKCCFTSRGFDLT